MQTECRESVGLNSSHFRISEQFSNGEELCSALLSVCLQTCGKGQRKRVMLWTLAVTSEPQPLTSESWKPSYGISTVIPRQDCNESILNM